MTKLSTMRTEDGKPQIKYKGIHEPKGRVKGYRVEIRPPNSEKKIWVGTFETRAKAMRAFDAAVYLTGKEPYYFIYPEDYFPTRDHKPAREFVQTEAKKFAERTDDLKVNPSSFLVDTSKGSSSAETSSRVTPNTPVESLGSNTQTHTRFGIREVEEFLQNADVPKVPAELAPALEADSLWSSWDLLVGEAKADVAEAKVGVAEAKVGVAEAKVGVAEAKVGVAEAKVDVAEAKADVEEAKGSVKEAELAAFDRGYNEPDLDALSALFGLDPPEFFLPCIEGASFVPVYEPSRPSSKRKRDALIGTDDATAMEEWWQNFDWEGPMSHCFGKTDDPVSPSFR